MKRIAFVLLVSAVIAFPSCSRRTAESTVTAGELSRSATIEAVSSGIETVLDRSELVVENPRLKLIRHSAGDTVALDLSGTRMLSVDKRESTVYVDEHIDAKDSVEQHASSEVSKNVESASANHFSFYVYVFVALVAYIVIRLAWQEISLRR